MYLPTGTLLHERYHIEGVLGHGGFGVTYLAQDTRLQVKVAVKEYLPRQLATRGEGRTRVSVFTGEARDHYHYGLAKFLEEAQALARFGAHPNIVSCRDFLEANGTAYMVMPYLEGVTLKEFLEQKGGTIPFETARDILLPLMDALKEVHRVHLLHRDISPDNIFLTTARQVKLIDFGTARYQAGEQSKSLSVILKGGYAPEEQYRSSGRQGPWTDVYAVAATLYKAVTGKTPPDALDRMDRDTLARPSELGAAMPPAAEAALLKALALRATERFQTVEDFQAALLGTAPVFPEAAVPTPTVDSGTAPPLPQPPRHHANRWLAPLAATVLLSGFIGGGAWWWWHRPEKLPEGNKAGAGAPQSQSPENILTGSTGSAAIPWSGQQKEEKTPVPAPGGVANKTPGQVKKEYSHYAGLAEELRLKGQFQQALPYYDLAINLNPNADDWIYNNRGLTHLKLKNYAAALADFNVALQLKPNDGLVHNNRANAWFGLHNYQQAYADLLQSQQLGHQINQDFFRKLAALIEKNGFTPPLTTPTHPAATAPLPGPRSCANRAASFTKRVNMTRPLPGRKNQSALTPLTPTPSTCWGGHTTKWGALPRPWGRSSTRSG